VRRDLEEIDFDRQIELAHQVGDEDEGAAQQPDDHELVGAAVVVGYLASEGLNARSDGFGRDQLVDGVMLGHGGAWLVSLRDYSRFPPVTNAADLDPDHINSLDRHNFPVNMSAIAHSGGKREASGSYAQKICEGWRPS